MGAKKKQKERGLSDNYHIPKLFPNDLFESFEWSHILALLDVCTNEAIPTQF